MTTKQFKTADVIHNEDGKDLEFRDSAIVGTDLVVRQNTALSEFTQSTKAIDLSSGNQGQEVAEGVYVTPEMPDDVYIAVLTHIDEYKEAQCMSIDKFLNRRITVGGVMMHPAQISVGDRNVVDANTGELLEYIDKTRTIIKVVSIDDTPLKEPMYISFVSDVVARNFRTRYIPRYGLHDWKSTLNFVVEQVATGKGRTYSFRLV